MNHTILGGLLGSLAGRLLGTTTDTLLGSALNTAAGWTLGKVMGSIADAIAGSFLLSTALAAANGFLGLVTGTLGDSLLGSILGHTLFQIPGTLLGALFGASAARIHQRLVGSTETPPPVLTTETSAAGENPAPAESVPDVQEESAIVPAPFVDAATTQAGGENGAGSTREGSIANPETGESGSIIAAAILMLASILGLAWKPEKIS